MSERGAAARETRIAGLDLLRSLAIVGVVLFHFSGEKGAWHVPFLRAFGWTGVDLFFVLSGFLIGGQLFERLRATGTISPLEFYRRRAFRILPAYATVVLLYAVWPGFRERPDLAPLWRFLTFTHNLGLDRATYRTFSQSWSLCVEEHFYLLFPLLVLALARARDRARAAWIAVVGFFVAGVLLRGFAYFQWVEPLAASGQAVGATFQKWIYYPTPTRLDGLLFGVGLALVRCFRPVAWARLVAAGGWAFLAGVGCLAAASALEPHALGTALWAYPLISAGYALWIPAATRLPVRVPGARGLAELAFAIYLTHKQVFHLFREALAAAEIVLPPVALTLASLPWVGLGAWILHRAVERPALASGWRERESRRCVPPA